MIFVALNEAAQKGELILVPDGFCRWHLRRDGVVVIREIIVLPFRRRTGVARRMVAQLRQVNLGRTILARCPEAYEANRFWGALGFETVAIEKGIITWQLHPALSGAPMATPPTAGPPSPLVGTTASDCQQEGC